MVHCAFHNKVITDLRLEHDEDVKQFMAFH